MPALPHLASRLGGFSAAALLPVVSSFLLFPVIARSSHPGEWVGVALGQSVGLVGAALVNLGWNALGPAEMADLDRAARDRRYVESLFSRGAVWLIAGPVAALVASTLAPTEGRVVAAAVAAAFSASGLSPRWFAVAEARPRTMIVWDVLPVVGSNLVAGLVIALGGSLLVYPALLVATTVSTALAFPAGNRRTIDVRGFVAAFRGRAPASLGELCGASYSVATVALVGSQAAASQMPQYASGVRLYQWGLLALVALTNALQAWAAAPGADRGERFLVLVRAHVVLGLLGSTILAVAGPPASAVLFGSDLRASGGVCVGLGLAYLAVALSTALVRHVLIISRRIDVVLAAVVLGAVVGVPVTLLLTAQFGVTGGAVGLAASELTVLLAAAPVATRAVRTARAVA